MNTNPQMAIAHNEETLTFTVSGQPRKAIVRWGSGHRVSQPAGCPDRPEWARR